MNGSRSASVCSAAALARTCWAVSGKRPIAILPRVRLNSGQTAPPSPTSGSGQRRSRQPPNAPALRSAISSFRNCSDASQAATGAAQPRPGWSARNVVASSATTYSSSPNGTSASPGPSAS